MTPKTLSVLHVSSSYPLSIGGSTAPFMEEMLSALASHGHRVTAIVPRVAGLQEGERLGVDVKGFAYGPTRAQVWGYGKSIDGSGRIKASAVALAPIAVSSMATKVLRFIRKERPDLLHLHWVLPQGILALMVPKRLPVVVSVHGADARLLTGSLKTLSTLILSRADAIVAASSSVLHAIERAVPATRGRTRVIPHGANTQLFSGIDRTEARLQLGIPGETVLVVAVGRLVPKKGFRTLIEAAATLGPDIKTVIVGDGPERARLGRLAVETHADVRLLGEVGRDEVAAWIAASNVVAIPSVAVRGDVDTGPVVLTEALAASRAVVTTRVGLAADLVVDGHNGLLVKPGDPESLADGILKALADRDSLEREGRRTFEEIGNWDRVADDLTEVYAEAITVRRGLDS